MDLISIVIPIYNVEKYIKKCLDSVLVQTYTNLEVICVNDGSTDSSGKIVCSYSDPRIRYFKKNNGGLSDARNFGIEKCTGNLVFLLDSDDYIFPNTIELLYNFQKKTDADVAIGEYIKVDENGIPIKDAKKNHLVNSSFNGKECYRNFWNYVELNVAWAKLYKTSFLKNYRFPFGKINEDEFIIYKTIYEASKVVLCNSLVYAYVVRNNSIMNSNFSSRNLDALEAYEKRIEYFTNNKEFTLVKNVERLILNWLSASIYKCSDKNLKYDLKRKYRHYYKRYRQDISLKGRLYLRYLQIKGILKFR